MLSHKYVKLNEKTTYSVYLSSYINDNDKPFVLFLHGLDCNALSFSLCAKILIEKYKYNLILPDLRHHGLTSSIDNKMTKEVITNDLETLLFILLKARQITNLIIIGHSFGGIICSHLTKKLSNNNNPNIKVIGCMIIDMLEDIALNSYDDFIKMLNNRPKYFNTKDEIIQYYINNKILTNINSAKLSTINNFIYDDNKYQWRTNFQLFLNKKLWLNWFNQFTTEFLTNSKKIFKIFITSNVRYLNTLLIKGQMQGLYQLVIIKDCLHFFHENQPEKCSIIIHNFISRCCI